MRLTKKQSAALLQAYRAGEDAQTLADEYGINAVQVSRIARKAGYFRRPVVSKVIRDKSRMWERAKSIGQVTA